MAYVYVSIGSNIEREKYIDRALSSLKQHFGALSLSSVYESEAVGFSGDNFYNLVAGFTTTLALSELSLLLKEIEDQHGRCRQGPKFSGRTLDIDILTYDQLSGVHSGIRLPRAEVTENAFVLWPLAEIAGDELHPQLQISYAALWQGYDKDRQKLWVVDFCWQGIALPARV